MRPHSMKMFPFYMLNILMIALILVVGCEAIQRIIQDPTTPDKIKEGGDVVVGVLPAPWNLVAGLSTGLLVGLFRAWQNKRVAKALVKRVELAKNGGTVVDFKSAEAKAVMATIKSTGADKLVDKLQNGGKTLPF